MNLVFGQLLFQRPRRGLEIFSGTGVGKHDLSTGDDVLKSTGLRTDWPFYDQ